MYQDVIYVTKTTMKMQAFVAGSKNTPDFAKHIQTVGDCGKIRYMFHDKDYVDCSPGDLIYYGGSRGNNMHLAILDPKLYSIIDGEIYEKRPIYLCSLACRKLPEFLSDIDIIWRNDHWFLNSPRLRIRVKLWDYWIRDIDPEHRYEVPVISCIEREGYSFDSYWRCNESGVLIEKLVDYDKRRFSSFAPSI